MESMRVLIVEDDHMIANAIKKGLTQERYAVDVCYTGTEGFDLATTETYDVMILDRMLPGMDGVDICKQMRKAGNHTPILLLTAKGQIQDKVEGLDAGADDYLTKPFSFEELLARLRALVRRPKTAVASQLAVGSLTMDTHSYEITRDGKEIHLSSREFSLLEYFMRNPGKILTKDMIIHHVWNYDADILPNTVEVYIRNLRRKIDDPFPNQPAFLQTVRGFGYKIG